VDQYKPVVDGAFIGTVVAALGGYLPTTIMVCTAIWAVLRIYDILLDIRRKRQQLARMEDDER
jgi:hypothetical protein